MNFNRLSGPEQFTLNIWVKGAAEDGALDKLTLPEIAKAATSALGFRVTAANIRGAREATGAEWKMKHDGNGRRNVTQAQLNVVVVGLQAVAAKLGLQFSDEYYNALARTQKTKEDPTAQGQLTIFEAEQDRNTA